MSKLGLALFEQRFQPFFEVGYTATLRTNLATNTLSTMDQQVCNILTDLGCQFRDHLFGYGHVMVSRDAHAETEFSIIFEQRVRPCRATSLGILAPGRCWQIAAINR